MCQLFALNSNSPTAVTFSFTGFSARGGRTAHHADGFGMAFHHGPRCRLFIDEAPACDAPLADFLRRHPIRARTVLAHIRKATQGRVALDNCHPFLREWRGRHWTFCHNGDLKGFHPEFTGPFLPVGDTDSERAFCWLLQRLRERLALATSSDSDSGPAATQWPVLAPLLGELAADVARCGPFNFLLSDGQALYAYGATRLHWLSRQHPFSTAHLVDSELSLDLASVNSPNDRMVLVATEPLTSNEPWLPFGTGELMVFAAGQAVWSSRPTARALDGEERPAELDNTPRHLVCPA